VIVQSQTTWSKPEEKHIAQAYTMCIQLELLWILPFDICILFFIVRSQDQTKPKVASFMNLNMETYFLNSHHNRIRGTLKTTQYLA